MADPVVVSTSLKVSFVSNDESAHSMTYDNMRSSLSPTGLSHLVSALQNAGHLFYPDIEQVTGLTLITKTETPLDFS